MSETKSALRTDLAKFYRVQYGVTKPSLFRKVKFWLKHFGLHCVIIYRFGKFAERLYRRNRLLGIPFVVAHLPFNYFMELIHHVNLSDATIGPGFFIGHVGTIYIGPVMIGANFSVTHNVTIGVGHSEGKSGLPEIGNNVWVGTGSVISGAITIGNRVTIANGTMLTRSVPDGCLVAGNPGRVVMNDFDNSELLAERVAP